MDDLPAVWKATCQVFEKAGVSPLSLDEFRKEFELPFTKFYDRYIPDVPIDRLERCFHDAFSREQHSVSPMPHAASFLDFCSENQIRSFVLSAIHPQHFQVHDQKSGFGSHFEKIYTGVWDKREKIHAIISAHGLTPEETLYIGDMEHDIETAHHGGMAGCAVLTGFKGLEALKQSQPELIVEHLGELKSLLEKTSFDPFKKEQSLVNISNSPFPIPTVGALIFNQNDEALMIRTHKWSDKWGIPGGKIHTGESSPDALRREIREETALEVDDIKFILVQDAISPSEFYRDAHFLLLNYTCRCRGLTPKVVLNDEAQEWCWVTLEDALHLDLNQPTQILVEAVLNEK
jgi:phosphoglycolate phosphatase